MKKFVLTYKSYLGMIILSLIIVGCSNNEMNHSTEKMVSEESESFKDFPDKKVKMSAGNLWQQKALHNFQNIIDLNILIKDDKIDTEIKSEINLELSNHFTSQLEMKKISRKLTELNINPEQITVIDMVSKQDTLEYTFQYDRAKIRAIYLIKNESKSFGDKIESFESIKLLDVEIINP